MTLFDKEGVVAHVAHQPFGAEGASRVLTYLVGGLAVLVFQRIGVYAEVDCQSLCHKNLADYFSGMSSKVFFSNVQKGSTVAMRARSVVV